MNLKNDRILPDYLKSMVDLKIAKAKSWQNKNTMSFAFFTDPHIVASSTFADISILNYINNNMSIKFAACCGDIFDNADTKELHLNTAAELISSTTIDNFFTVKGNHDDNSLIFQGSDNIQYSMLPKEQYDIIFKKIEGTVSFDVSNKYGLYYYYDIPGNNVRAIFLNSIDIPYIPDSQIPTAWKYAGQNTYAYSNAQLNWLAHTALKLPTSDWRVLLFTHINPFPEGMIGADDLVHNGSTMLGILDAFKAGNNFISIPSTGDFAQNISVDFSPLGPGKIIAFFYGHTHSEQVLSRNGIKYISTWNDSPYKSSSNPDAPKRAKGTISEICLTVATIDFLAK